MKIGLCVLSLMGAGVAGYSLIVEVATNYPADDFIIIALWGVLLLQCAVGLFMTLPDIFFKRGIKFTMSKTALKK